jgi:hypothetical protein
MSKVKNFDVISALTSATMADNSHKHEKMKRAQRRKEKANLNAQRIKIDGKYGQYQVIDTKDIITVTREYVPEQVVPIRHLVCDTYCYLDKDGNKQIKEIYRWVETGTKVVPAHYRNVKHHLGEEPIKPYVRKWHVNKKWARKEAARKLRRTNNSELYSKGLFKKVFDVKWSVY